MMRIFCLKQVMGAVLRWDALNNLNGREVGPLDLSGQESGALPDLLTEKIDKEPLSSLAARRAPPRHHGEVPDGTPAASTSQAADPEER
jgi:hypothetical protein